MRLRPILALGICAILVIVFVSHTTRRRAADEQHAKEATLRAELAGMREAIRRYAAGHHAGPHALRDLVADGQAKSVPVDPVTGSADTWKLTLEQTVRTDDFSASAPASAAAIIVDVHSGASGTDSTGRRWSDY
jgi:general secretion pathway protein G